MIKQQRTIKTPCCDARTKIKFDRGDLKPIFKCRKCGRHYRVWFSQGPKGRTGRVIRKEIIYDEV